MAHGNAFSAVASDALRRVRDIVDRFVGHEVPVEARERLLDELKLHETTLARAFRFRQRNGPPLGPADTEAYFSEKLAALSSFARMALTPEARGGFGSEEIVEGVSHYSYLVARLVAARWESRSRRPAADRIIRETAFEHREALARLADR